MKTIHLMLHSEIVRICSEICTKHTNSLHGKNVEYFNIKTGGT